MAQVIGEFSQWKYGDPPRPDPRDPKWLGPDAAEGMEAGEKPYQETVQRLWNQKEFVNNRMRADAGRRLLIEFQTGTGSFAPGRNGPGGVFRDKQPRQIYTQLKDAFLEDENAAVKNYHDLGYEKNPYMWNKLTRPPQMRRGRDTDRWQPAPRMLIDKLYRE